jgi:hypothetical protein
MSPIHRSEILCSQPGVKKREIQIGRVTYLLIKNFIFSVIFKAQTLCDSNLTFWILELYMH